MTRARTGEGVAGVREHRMSRGTTGHWLTKWSCLWEFLLETGLVTKQAHDAHPANQGTSRSCKLKAHQQCWLFVLRTLQPTHDTLHSAEQCFLHWQRWSGTLYTLDETNTTQRQLKCNLFIQNFFSFLKIKIGFNLFGSCFRLFMLVQNTKKDSFRRGLSSAVESDCAFFPWWTKVISGTTWTRSSRSRMARRSWRRRRSTTGWRTCRTRKTGRRRARSRRAPLPGESINEITRGTKSNKTTLEELLIFPLENRKSFSREKCFASSWRCHLCLAEEKRKQR